MSWLSKATGIHVSVHGSITNPKVEAHVDWNAYRDFVEANAVVTLNLFYPGSSIVTSHLVSKGAQKKVRTLRLIC